MRTARSRRRCRSRPRRPPGSWPASARLAPAAPAAPRARRRPSGCRRPSSRCPACPHRGSSTVPWKEGSGSGVLPLKSRRRKRPRGRFVASKRACAGALRRKPESSARGSFPRPRLRRGVALGEKRHADHRQLPGRGTGAKLTDPIREIQRRVCASSESMAAPRRQTGALAHQRLALQREGALGARPQAGAAQAPRGLDPRPAHPRLDAAHRRRQPHLPGAARSTAARSATRARSSPRWRSATPSGRSIPADPEQRRRALELEDFFDEELGPHIRLLAFHELGKDPERFEAVIARTHARPGRRASAAARSPTPAPTPACASASAARRRPRSRAARSSPRSTGSRPSSAPNEYLVGDSFSVADLTAAALFFPLVLPDEGPVPTDEPPPAGHRQLPRPARGAPRLPLGRRDLPQAPASRRPSRSPPSAHPYRR